MSGKPKAKLRTAADVINRFQWAHEDATCQLVKVGYDDRINGPLEIPIHDWVPIKNGGDTPEHRILYFRREGSSNENTTFGEIIWDRAGRVDKVFGSGNGAHEIVSEKTRQIAVNAIKNTQLLEEERAEKRIAKAKERNRKAGRRARARAVKTTLNYNTVAKVNEANSNNLLETGYTEGGNTNKNRFAWHTSPWFTYNSDKSWRLGADAKKQYQVSPQTGSELKVITWNVLFDIFDQDETKDSSSYRWKCLANALENCEADVICLQEVTPDVVHVLCTVDWIQASYGMSATLQDTSSVYPQGNLILWKLESLSLDSPEDLLICTDGDRKGSRVVAASFKRNITHNQVASKNSDTLMNSFLLIANIHLPADRNVNLEKTNAQDNSPTSRAQARRRELSAVVGQLARMEDRIADISTTDSKNSNILSIIAGDFNSEEEELADGCFSGSSSLGIGFFQDAWNNGPGYTFDPVSNLRANRSKELVGATERRRRIDRIYYKKTHSHIQSNAELLTGVGSSSHDEKFLPSDHFGVMATLVYQEKIGIKPSESVSVAVDSCSVEPWAAISMACKDSALSLVLRQTNIAGNEESTIENIKKSYCSQSSLVQPHITLLHGFVELHDMSGY